METRWSQPETEDGPSRPLPTDPDWAGGSLREQLIERRVDADAETLWRALESIAAAQAAPPGPRAWNNRLTGMAKVGRTSAHNHLLHAGESPDSWLVEQIERPVVRLRANVPLSGRLWLELSVHDDGDSGCLYRQRTLFQPYGLPGEALWIASAPARKAVFGGIARDITANARGASAATRA